MDKWKWWETDLVNRKLGFQLNHDFHYVFFAKFWAYLMNYHLQSPLKRYWTSNFTKFSYYNRMQFFFRMKNNLQDSAAGVKWGFSQCSHLNTMTCLPSASIWITFLSDSSRILGCWKLIVNSTYVVCFKDEWHYKDLFLIVCIYKYLKMTFWRTKDFSLIFSIESKLQVGITSV